LVFKKNQSEKYFLLCEFFTQKSGAKVTIFNGIADSSSKPLIQQAGIIQDSAIKLPTLELRKSRG
jgi:hypothetical protein